MFQKTKGWLMANKLLASISALMAGLLIFTYTINLKNLVSTTNLETANALGINNFDSFVNNISFAPTKLGIYAISLLTSDYLFTRLLSAITVLIAITVFFYLISKWHTRRVAMYATILFALSSYSLHAGRITNIDALYYAFIPILILMATWLKTKKTVNRFIYIAPILAIFAYLPGTLIIVIIFSLLFQRRIRLAWKFIDTRIKLISLSLASLILVPLIYSLILKPSQVGQFFSVDLVLDQNYQQIYDKFINFFPAVVYNGINQPDRWLYGTPVLEVGSLVLFVLGVYAYKRGTHPLRARLLLTLLIICLALYSTGTLTTLTLIIPIFYIVIANGVAFLLQTWFTVFPKNPAARNTAIITLSLFVAIIGFYHAHRYFQAWPNARETKALSRPIDQ